MGLHLGRMGNIVFGLVGLMLFAFLSALQLLDPLFSEVKSFTQKVPQGDDQTVVVLVVEA